MAKSFFSVVNTVLCLGLNLLLKKLGVAEKYRYLLWCVVAVNEIRGIAMGAVASKPVVEEAAHYLNAIKPFLTQVAKFIVQYM